MFTITEEIKSMSEKDQVARTYDIENFNESEFPEPVDTAEVGLWLRLNATRISLDEIINPSKGVGALSRGEYTREDGEILSTIDLTPAGFYRLFSEYPGYHQIIKGRKSQAVDIFTKANPLQAFYHFSLSYLWDDIGVYFDTKNNKGEPQIMFHLGYGRVTKLLWFRLNRRYCYETSARFWPTLLRLLYKNSPN